MLFTVADNIILGSEPVKPWPFIDHRSATERIVALAKEYNFHIDPAATIENLPIGQQQRVEILKALSHNAEILILDEPTAVLTPQEEADALMVIMRTLKAQGKSIIFITHKLLKEVLEIADVITVMRLGQVVGTTTPAETNEAALATMMVGNVDLVVEKPPATPGEVVLDVRQSLRAGRPGLDRAEGHFVRRASRRDSRLCRRPRKWTDRTRRGAHRSADARRRAR